jgi:hypothetical protein
MQTLLIAVPYYNNSHFIPLQIYSCQKYLKNCNWKLLVLDDSNDTTVNVLTHEKEDIQSVCKKYAEDCIYFKIPQTLHKASDSAWIRHRDICTYLMSTVAPTYAATFDYLMIFDADMCFIDTFDFPEIVDNCDIIAPRRKQWLGDNQCSTQFKVFDFFWTHCCFLNLKRITNIHELDMGAVPRTSCDTGSMIYRFMIDNPQYKLKFHEFSTGNELIEPLNFEFLYNNRIIHFGSGTLWNPDDKHMMGDKYKYKMDRFIQTVHTGLTETDREHIAKQNTDIWYPNRKYQLEHPSQYCTPDEFRQFLSYAR